MGRKSLLETDSQVRALKIEMTNSFIEDQLSELFLCPVCLEPLADGGSTVCKSFQQCQHKVCSRCSETLRILAQQEKPPCNNRQPACPTCRVVGGTAVDHAFTQATLAAVASLRYKCNKCSAEVKAADRSSHRCAAASAVSVVPSSSSASSSWPPSLSSSSSLSSSFGAGRAQPSLLLLHSSASSHHHAFTGSATTSAATSQHVVHVTELTVRFREMALVAGLDTTSLSILLTDLTQNGTKRPTDYEVSLAIVAQAEKAPHVDATSAAASVPGSSSNNNNNNTTSSVKKSKAAFYAVACGRKTGVYETWAETEQQVKGFTGAVHKKFDSRDSAESFVAAYSAASLSASPLPTDPTASATFNNNLQPTTRNSSNSTVIVDADRQQDDEEESEQPATTQTQSRRRQRSASAEKEHSEEKSAFPPALPLPPPAHQQQQPPTMPVVSDAAGSTLQQVVVTKQILVPPKPKRTLFKDVLAARALADPHGSDSTKL